MQNKWSRGRERSASYLLNNKSSAAEIRFQKKVQAARRVKANDETSADLKKDLERNVRSGR
jgi:hypothetical protein